MPANEYPLSLVIKAVDKATGPLQKINDTLKRYNAPFNKLSKTFKEFGEVSGLTKVGDSLRELGTSSRELGSRVMETGKRFLELGVVAGLAFFEILKSSAEAGAELEHAAHRTGMTVDAYAQLRFAATQSGVAQEEFASGIDRATRSMSQARDGAGPLYELLAKRAPVLAEQFKHAKNSAEGMKLLAATFRAETDAGRRAQIVQAAFGRGAKEMGDFLALPQERIEGLMARYNALAGSQEDYAAQSVAFEQGINELSASFDGLRAKALGPLMPALKQLASTLADLIAKNSDKLKVWAETTGKAISDWVANDGIGKLTRGIGDLADKVDKVVQSIGGWQNVAIAMGVLINGPLIGAAANWALALGKVAWALGSALLPVILSAATAIGTLVEALGLGFTVVESLQLAFGTTAVAMAPFVLAAVGIGAAGYEIYKNWLPLKELFADIWNNAKQLFDALIHWHAPTGLRNLTGTYDAAPAFKGLPASSMRDNSSAPYANGLGAAAAAPTPTSQAASSAKIQVDFVNMPKGARVSSKADDDVDLSTAYGASNVIPS